MSITIIIKKFEYLMLKRLVIQIIKKKIKNHLVLRWYDDIISRNDERIYSTYNTWLIDILFDLIINVEMLIKNLFDFWFDIFDKNDNILMMKSNIDFEFIVEHDDNYVYLIYKFVYCFHEQFNDQSKIAIYDFHVQKNNVDRSWNLILSNLRVEYVFNNIFTSIIFVHLHVNHIR